MQSSATRIGRTHRLLGQNCHDFSFVGEPEPGFCFGLVLDGCGSKHRAAGFSAPSHNEVGAKLLGAFAANFLHQQIPSRSEGARSLAPLLEDLHQGSMTFLHGFLSSIPFADQEARIRFAATHLLSTVVGYVMTPESATFFWSGDGYFCLNGQITKLNSDNRPHYLAYQLFSDGALSGGQERGFQMAPISCASETIWLAVATDGWNSDLLRRLEVPRPGLSLQRWLNSQARRRGQFEDDAAVATWYREPDVQTELA